MTKFSENELLLDASGIAKSFGSVHALTDANLKVRAGEVVALMGANGAGKSTFIKILTGALRPDGGQISFLGDPVSFGSPGEARASGLIPVYQEHSLIPDLSVSDNLRLTNTDPVKFWDCVSDLGIDDVKLDDQISSLPLATLRILDLARALASNAKV